jgi:hypothetical protein
MPAQPEVLGDGTISGKEPLGVTRGLEPLHASLSLAGGLVGVLGAVIEIPVLAMFDSWKNFAFGRSIALEFVSDEHARDVGQAFQEFAEELLRGPLIPAALDQNIQHGPVLIDRPLEIVPFSLDRQKHLIHMPLIAWPRAAAQLVGILLAELATPFADGLIRHDHAALKQ